MNMENIENNNLSYDELLRYNLHLKKKRYEKTEQYEDEVKIAIQAVYLLAIFIWVVFILYFEIDREMDIVILFFLAIPIVLYIISFFSTNILTRDNHEGVLNANYLSFGFLIVIIMINWTSPNKDLIDHSNFLKLILIAFILIMLSMLDIWVSEKWLALVIHIRTILLTAALVILSMSLYIFYLNHTGATRNKKAKNVPLEAL